MRTFLRGFWLPAAIVMAAHSQRSLQNPTWLIAVVGTTEGTPPKAPRNQSIRFAPQRFAEGFLFCATGVQRGTRALRLLRPRDRHV